MTSDRYRNCILLPSLSSHRSSAIVWDADLPQTGMGHTSSGTNAGAV